MDIIMEKTKGLTMSEEEKAEYKQQELTGKVRGLIQKFLDGFLNMDRLKVEVAALSGIQEDAVNRIIVEESIPHIQLGEQREPILNLLEKVVGLDIVPIREMEMALKERLEGERETWEKSLKEKLEKKGVSGSAVIPNLKADPDWKQHVSDEKEIFGAKIRSRLKSD
jgi:hypothetical protein